MVDQRLHASITLDGIRLVNLALHEAVDAIDGAVAAGRPTRIAFVNADCANLATRDQDYRRDLADFDWTFVDGVGMRIAGKIMAQPVRDNVNGTDLFPLLCAALARRNRSLYLLGARPGVAAAAAEWARQRHPGLRIAGTADGYFEAAEAEDVARTIRRTQPDVLLVALGAPRQEAWIQRHFPATGATVAIGVGGLFDYYSNRIPRAPLWMRRTGLEWVFRLYQEPRRLWRRYLVGNALFMARLIRNRCAGVNTAKLAASASPDAGG